MKPKPLKVCEQCGDEYQAGTGTSEDHGRGRVRLSERFCTDGCADEYNASFESRPEEG